MCPVLSTPARPALDSVVIEPVSIGLAIVLQAQLPAPSSKALEAVRRYNKRDIPCTDLQASGRRPRRRTDGCCSKWEQYCPAV